MWKTSELSPPYFTAFQLASEVASLPSPQWWHRHWPPLRSAHSQVHNMASWEVNNEIYSIMLLCLSVLGMQQVPTQAHNMASREVNNEIYSIMLLCLNILACSKFPLHHTEIHRSNGLMLPLERGKLFLFPERQSNLLFYMIPTCRNFLYKYVSA